MFKTLLVNIIVDNDDDDFEFPWETLKIANLPLQHLHDDCLLTLQQLAYTFASILNFHSSSLPSHHYHQ